jgi:predicted GIY-YIG superfamily endonuclease
MTTSMAYMVRRADDTLYTGIAKDAARRSPSRGYREEC